MPWKVSSVVQQRLELIYQWMKGEHSVAELARLFGISRKTAYKLISRWQESPDESLADRPRQPRSSPNRTPPEVCRRILEKRSERPTWGPGKILAWLRREQVSPLPAVSTAAAILKRSGMVPERRRRRHATPSPSLIEASGANELWCTDFKRWFRVGTASGVIR